MINNAFDWNDDVCTTAYATANWEICTNMPTQTNQCVAYTTDMVFIFPVGFLRRSSNTINHYLYLVADKLTGVWLLAKWHVHGCSIGAPNQFESRYGVPPTQVYHCSRCCPLLCPDYRRDYDAQGNPRKVKNDDSLLNEGQPQWMILIKKYPLSSGQLTQERAASREKNQPLCMAQYHRLLGSCRRPGDPRDSQYLPETKEDHHVIVTCRNQVNSGLLNNWSAISQIPLALSADVLHTCSGWWPWQIVRGWTGVPISVHFEWRAMFALHGPATRCTNSRLSNPVGPWQTKVIKGLPEQPQYRVDWTGADCPLPGRTPVE